MGSWTPSAPLGMPQRGEQLSISPPQAMVTSSSSSASSIPHEPNWESRLQRSCCNPPAAAGFGAGAAQVRHALVGSNWPFPLRGLIVDLMSAERSVTALRFRASRRHRIELDVGPSRFRGLVQSVGALRSVGAFGRSGRACHLIACQVAAAESVRSRIPPTVRNSQLDSDDLGSGKQPSDDITRSFSAPAGWDAADPKAWLGPATKDFEEWEDIRARLVVWKQDAQAYAEELRKLEEQIQRHDRNAPVVAMRFLPSGIELIRTAAEFGTTLVAGTSAVIVAQTSVHVAAVLAGLSLVGAAIEWNNALPFVRRNEISSADRELNLIAERIQDLMADYDENASYWEQPWDRAAATVDAVAHTIGPAREIDAELRPRFRQAQKLLSRFS